jgi:hypothetical protein
MMMILFFFNIKNLVGVKIIQMEKQFNTCVGRCWDDTLKYHLRGIVVGKEKSSGFNHKIMIKV